MNDADIARLIDARIAAALTEHDRRIAPAIAEGLRVHSNRPAPEKGAPSLAYGTVDAMFPDDGYANVLLDGETVATPFMTLAALEEGERVAVLFHPPQGGLAFGQVAPGNPATIDGLTIDQFDLRAGPLDGTEEVPVWWVPGAGGQTWKVTAQSIADLATPPTADFGRVEAYCDGGQHHFGFGGAAADGGVFRWGTLTETTGIFIATNFGDTTNGLGDDAAHTGSEPIGFYSTDLCVVQVALSVQYVPVTPGDAAPGMNVSMAFNDFIPAEMTGQSAPQGADVTLFAHVSGSYLMGSNGISFAFSGVTDGGGGVFDPTEFEIVRASLLLVATGLI